MRKNTALQRTVYHGNIWCSSGSRSKGNKTETLHWTLEEKMQSFFFPLCEQYQSEYHCYSKTFAFCLEARDSQHHARWPVWRSWLGRGASYRVPLVCGLWGIEQEPRTAAPPPTLRLTHLKVRQAAPARPADGPLIPKRGGESAGGPPLLVPAVVSASPPSLSPLTL